MNITPEELQKMIDDAYNRGKVDALANALNPKIEYVPIPAPWQVAQYPYVTYSFGSTTLKEG